MRRILFSCLLTFLFIDCIAQQSNSIKLPTVVPPPPDAAALGRYGDIPVSMHTGTAGVEVPFYEIKTPKLSLPINLNYNTSGIKVNDMATWVGLGWSLNSGGVITRSIRGLDDFIQGGFYRSSIPHESNITPENSWKFFQNYMNNTQDGDPDYFFFNFGPYSGKFIFGEDKKPMIINYQQPLKISFTYPNNTFTIWDEKGNSYYFNSQEHASSGEYNGRQNPDYISSWYLSKIVSFDRTDSITFSYTKDVNITEQDQYSYAETVGPYVKWIDCASCPGGWTSSYMYTGQDGCCGAIAGQSFVKSYPLRLNEINFKNGKVQLYTTGNRKDVYGVTLDSIKVLGYDYSSSQFKTIKRLNFNYSYFFTNLPKPAYEVFPVTLTPYRLRLDSVSISNQNTFGGTYRFYYDGSMLPWLTSTAQDLFGYFNGKLNNISLIPSQTVLYSNGTYNVGGGDRSVDKDSIQAGILKKMVYPTGGYSTFQYEPNSYASNETQTYVKQAHAIGSTHQTDTVYFTGASADGELDVDVTAFNYTTVHTRPIVSLVDLTLNKTIFLNGLTDPDNGYSSTTYVEIVAGHSYRLIAQAFDDSRVNASIKVIYRVQTGNVVGTYGGGLRVKQIIDYDGNGKMSKSELYKYGYNECGYGYMPSQNYLFNAMSKERAFTYPKPTEITVSPDNVVNRLLFSSSPIYDLFTFSGAPVCYSQVSKYIVDSTGNNIGKTVANYNIYQNSVMPASDAYSEAMYIVNSGFTGGQILSNIDYANKSGTYWPVKKTVNSFVNNYLPSGRGLRIGTRQQWSPQLPPLDSNSVVTSGAFMSLYYYFEYPINSGTVLPSDETIYEYDQSDTTKYLVTSKHFDYDDLNHLQPTRIQSFASDGKPVVTVNRYPAEVDSIIGLTPNQIAAVDTMQGRHNITALIQTQTFKNNNPQYLTRYDYKIWPNGIIQPDSVEYQVGSGPRETRLRFYNYDNYGNILQNSKSSDVIQSYVWDYGSSLPIAQVVGATSNDIAYTSFEGDGTGSWSGITSSSIIKGSLGPTGNNYYQAAFNISKVGLNAASSYKITYWSNNGPYSVSGTAAGWPILIMSSFINGQTWNCYEHLISGVSSTSVSGTGGIDELRLYPSKALMTTYTYKPLVGETSVCDSKNNITYYEYDDLARLSAIKDKNGNVSKRMYYYYNGQVDNPPCSQIFNFATGITYSSSNVSKSGTAVTLSLVFTYPGTTIFTLGTIAGSCYYPTVSRTVPLTIGSSVFNMIISTNGTVQVQLMSGPVPSGSISLQGIYDLYATTYYSAAASGSFTRACPSGQVGSNVTYSVPAYKYSSTSGQYDADQMAKNDVTLNGQNYANANGTCTAGLNVTGTNSRSDSYSVTFTNTSNSSLSYSFSISAGSTNVILGQIPSGTYNVVFRINIGTPVNANFSIGPYTMTNVTTATFSNIPISSTILAKVY